MEGTRYQVSRVLFSPDIVQAVFLQHYSVEEAMSDRGREKGESAGTSALAYDRAVVTAALPSTHSRAWARLPPHHLLTGGRKRAWHLPPRRVVRPHPQHAGLGRWVVSVESL